jgi:hypothetical protein
MCWPASLSLVSSCIHGAAWTATSSLELVITIAMTPVSGLFLHKSSTREFLSPQESAGNKLHSPIRIAVVELFVSVLREICRNSHCWVDTSALSVTYVQQPEPMAFGLSIRRSRLSQLIRVTGSRWPLWISPLRRPIL